MQFHWQSYYFAFFRMLFKSLRIYFLLSYFELNYFPMSKAKKKTANNLCTVRYTGPKCILLYIVGEWFVFESNWCIQEFSFTFALSIWLVSWSVGRSIYCYGSNKGQHRNGKRAISPLIKFIYIFMVYCIFLCVDVTQWHSIRYLCRLARHTNANIVPSAQPLSSFLAIMYWI